MNPDILYTMEKTTLPKAEFLLGKDVTRIARNLLGKRIVVNSRGVERSGIIIETEAYAGIHDRASHAYGGRYTGRTQTMYRQGGTCYVYLCYGIHKLFNIVTGPEGRPDAVLIRGVLREREGKIVLGPGRTSRELGIELSHNGEELGGKIRLEEAPFNIPATWVLKVPRIGIDYAGRDKFLPYRFFIGPEKLKTLILTLNSINPKNHK
jgi:DNA-3-methyladenine glycosylase